MGPQSPKTKFVLQNLYCCVISPSIGNFIRSKKKHTFGGQKGENKPSGHIYVFWDPKSVRSCDIFIDQEFYIDEDNTRS
jgi:hypothetical protein